MEAIWVAISRVPGHTGGLDTRPGAPPTVRVAKGPKWQQGVSTQTQEPAA